MGLLAWYPLNGDTKDYSGNNVMASNFGAIESTGGKIGKCYNFGSSYMTVSNKIANGASFSIAFWVKFNSNGSNQCIYNSRTVAGDGLSLFNLSGTLRFDAGGQWSISNHAPPVGTWIHYVFIKDSTSKKIYINGSLHSTLNTSAPLANVYSEASIGCSRVSIADVSNYLNGSLNDVRIYDHALSTKEIKELAKAKILHYTFDEPVEPFVNLAKNKTYAIYNNYGQPATLIKTGEIYKGCDVYRLTFTVTNSTYLANFQTSLANHGIYWFYRTFKANTKYAFGIHYKPVTHADTRVGGAASNMGGWSEIAPKMLSDGWNFVGQKVTVGTADKSDSIFTSFRCASLQLNEPISIDFACPVLVEGKDYIPEILNYQYDSFDIVSDSSGFRNHGVVNYSNSPKWQSDSILGSGSYYFDGGLYRYITTPYGAGVNMAEVTHTISMWVKTDDIAANKILFGTENGANQRFYLSTYAGKWDIGIQSSGWGSGATSTANNSWTHIAVVMDGSKANLYINGAFSFSKNYTPYTIVRNFWIGICWADASYQFKGSVDDVRVYATALSQQDILDIYSVRASVSDAGKLFAEELIETKNLFDPNLILRRQTEIGVSTSSRKVIYTNVDTLALSAASYYKSRAECSVFPTSYFEPNTSYTFCITINSNLQYNNAEVPGGFTIRYSDGTQYTGFGVKTSGSWKQIVYTTPSNKTITDVFVYYYVGNLFYIDIENTWIRKSGQTNLGSNGVFQSNGIQECVYRPGMLDYSTWTFTAGWSLNGTSAENGRTIHGNPKKNLDMVWVSPSNDIESNADGGFVSPSVVIDNTKKYRFSVWIRRENIGSGSGTAYFGLHGYNSTSANNGILTLAGAVNTNPYFTSFEYTGYSEAVVDKWALLVGYVHPHTYASTAVEPETGIYSIDGVKLGGFENFKWSSTAYYAQLRAYLYYSTKTDERMYFYRPRIDLIDGSEPSIQTLLKCAEHPPLVDPNGVYYSQNIFAISDSGQLYSPEFIES